MASKPKEESLWEKIKKNFPWAKKEEPPPPPSRAAAQTKQVSAQKTLETALYLQSWWRGTLVRRSLLFATLCAMSIQRWWRRRAFQLKEERRIRALMMYVWPEKSTVLLQSKLRMWLTQTQFKKYQKAAQVIQNNWRKYVLQQEFSNYSLNNLTYDGIDLNIDIIVE
ncbi:IQ domain-containing protein F6 isoform X1 [Crotalus tigris]|uniref:IQ domain-containing protein F6 isoform X1 n=1 Tax=Crotalus tigris TaxID=88082 RepID=UPI00192FAA48|nr:IQ domain-containing protein F6 isoform X1 [Crotalus tigris]